MSFLHRNIFFVVLYVTLKVNYKGTHVIGRAFLNKVGCCFYYHTLWSLLSISSLTKSHKFALVVMHPSIPYSASGILVNACREIILLSVVLVQCTCLKLQTITE